MAGVFAAAAFPVQDTLNS